LIPGQLILNFGIFQVPASWAGGEMAPLPRQSWFMLNVLLSILAFETLRKRAV